MKFAEFMKTLASPDGIRKLLNNEWTFPPVERAMPVFYASLAGFVVASAVSLGAASALMPKPRTATAKAGARNAGKNTKGAPGATAISGPEFNMPPAGDFMPAGAPLPLPQAPLLADFKTISQRNLFNSEGMMGESPDGVKAQCELKKSELPLKFTGIIFGGQSETSLVLLESQATRQSETFLLHDLAPGDAEIVEIQKDKIIFERNGCREYLDLEAPELPKRRVAGQRQARPDNKSAQVNLKEGYKEDGFERKGFNTQVERRWVDKALGIDFAKTLQDAKASPNLVGSEIKGFVLTKIRPDSVYEKMGLADGDTVEAINGIELNGMAQAVQTLNAMRNESNITLQVKRNGQTLNFTVDIRK